MRRRAGEYSELRVMQLGSTPPRPMPVTKRSRLSTSMLGERAEARVPRPKIATQVSSTTLRPWRSARGPKQKLPRSMPNNPAPKAGASCARSMFQCWINSGAM